MNAVEAKFQKGKKAGKAKKQTSPPCGTHKVGYRPSGDGETYKEALANVEIIVQEWIETAKELGRPIPAPRGRLAFA